MKKRYELQYKRKRWCRAMSDKGNESLKSKIQACKDANKLFYPMGEWRVVQKLGRKVIKVVYPKGV